MDKRERLNKVVRIGGASGFWGDSCEGALQLVRRGKIDYLAFDYLAELTMSILASARTKKPELGYATDFITGVMKELLAEIVARNIRVVSNAGGVNPRGCAAALAGLATELGIPLRIAVVEGDDVMPEVEAIRSRNTIDVPTLDGRKPLPARLITANAYLGALPVKVALDEGAQVVITGRCVDSAVTLGILMHEFGWSSEAYDLLAAGSLAGHIIECGAQATGGLHTDWETVPDWPDIGYPIITCRDDGSFTVGKAPGTGGSITSAGVAEQVLYEIGDPASYVLPDVICDFRSVTTRLIQQDVVEVRGARGRSPTSTYKVSATYADGFRASAQMTIIGENAAAKAKRTADAILVRTRQVFRRNGWRDYTDSNIELLGTESCYGPHAQPATTREVVLRLSVAHAEKAPLDCFSREIAAAGTSWSPGTAGIHGRPSPSPSIKQFAFLLDKRVLSPSVEIEGRKVLVPIPEGNVAPDVVPDGSAGEDSLPSNEDSDLIEVPLIHIAFGRSGDKGDTSNVGIIARSPALWPYLRRELSAERVAEFLGHLVKGAVRRYELPGILAMNFVCEQALGGGGMASLRNDPLGKGMAQILLALRLRVPPNLLRTIQDPLSPSEINVSESELCQ